MCTVLNAAPALPDLDPEILENTDILVLNQTEAEIISGISGKSLFKKKPHTVEINFSRINLIYNLRNPDKLKSGDSINVVHFTFILGSWPVTTVKLQEHCDTFINQCIYATREHVKKNSGKNTYLSLWKYH